MPHSTYTSTLKVPKTLADEIFGTQWICGRLDYKKSHYKGIMMHQHNNLNKKTLRYGGPLGVGLGIK